MCRKSRVVFLLMKSHFDPATDSIQFPPDLPDKFRMVDERVPVALKLPVNDIVPSALPIVDRVQFMPFQQIGEYAHIRAMGSSYHD